MAAQNEILINFRPKGDRKLIKAFNDLAKKGSLYANETFNWQKIALDYEEQFLKTIEKFNSC